MLVVFVLRIHSEVLWGQRPEPPVPSMETLDPESASPAALRVIHCCVRVCLLCCRDDVAVNPNDTEESIWAFLCEAQLQGPDAARSNMLKVRLPGWQLPPPPHSSTSLHQPGSRRGKQPAGHLIDCRMQSIGCAGSVSPSTTPATKAETPSSGTYAAGGMNSRAPVRMLQPYTSKLLAWLSTLLPVFPVSLACRLGGTLVQ